jgi:hypothetical protein
MGLVSAAHAARLGSRQAEALSEEAQFKHVGTVGRRHEVNMEGRMQVCEPLERQLLAFSCHDHAE